MEMLMRDSFVFKVAYGLRDKGDVPEKTTRCKLFWRFVLSTLLWWPMVGIFSAIFLLILLVFSVGFFLFAGYKFNFKEEKGPSGRADIFVPIKTWPKIWGRRFQPWVGWAGLFFAWLTYISWNVLVRIPGMLWEVPTMIHEAIGLSTLGLYSTYALIIALIIALMRRFRRTEVWQLFSGYMGDVKQRFCPIIPIEQLPEPEEEEEKEISQEDEEKAGLRRDLEEELGALREEAQEFGLNLSWRLE